MLSLLGNVLNRTKDNSTTEHSNNNMNMTETSDTRMLCSDNISIPIMEQGT